MKVNRVLPKASVRNLDDTISSYTSVLGFDCVNRSVVYPIETFAYGMREFAIRDNNGYILQFGREV